MTIYETWEERDGATMRQRVGTDAPAGIRLIDADDYEALKAKYQRLRGILRNLYENRMEGDKLYIILDRPETKAALTEQGENDE